MLRAVIRNLISNAIKFTPKQGFVKVSAEVRHDYVHVLVTDSGIGIKPETIGKLFKIETSFTTRGTENEKEPVWDFYSAKNLSKNTEAKSGLRVK